MESCKNVVAAGMIALVLVVVAVMIQSGMVKSSKGNLAEACTLYGFEGVLYRLSATGGRLDVLVPGSKAAISFSMGRFRLPDADANGNFSGFQDGARPVRS